MSTEIQEAPGVFTGFKIIEPAPMDSIFGAETSILNLSRNDNLDWRPDIPTFKCQLMKDSQGMSHGDSNSCVSFSATNDLSCQLDWLIAHGQIDPNGLNFLQSNGYTDSTGHINLSPRFTSKMSGTNPQTGNSLPAVWNSLSTQGAVPESVWPMPVMAFDALNTNNITDINQYWNAYFSTIDPQVILLGAKFASWFTTQFEWLAFEGNEKTIDQFQPLLNVAPIHIATAVCNGWNTDNPIQACGDGAQHATTMLNIEPATAYDILDHYNPYMKRFSPTYSISYAVRGVIASTPQNPALIPSFTYNYQTNLTFGAKASMEITALQQGLQTVLDKTGKPYMSPGVFGPFGPQTLRAVARFQVDNGIVDEPKQGYDFGPLTRTALTEALEAIATKTSGVPTPRPLNPDAHRPN